MNSPRDALAPENNSIAIDVTPEERRQFSITRLRLGRLRLEAPGALKTTGKSIAGGAAKYY